MLISQLLSRFLNHEDICMFKKKQGKLPTLLHKIMLQVNLKIMTAAGALSP